MSHHYTTDCQQWARQKLSDPAFAGQARLLRLTPLEGKVLGGLRHPDGSIEYPDWHYHYAVEYDGLLYDEACPQGLAASQFKQRFIYAESIKYTPA